MRSPKRRRPRFLGAKIWAPTAPCDNFSIGRPNLQSSYFCREAIPASLLTEPAPLNPERGPDGIRTRICYRRRVLCCRYTAGPPKAYAHEQSRSQVTRRFVTSQKGSVDTQGSTSSRIE